jgi:TetR/AcrR family transcriptional regulator
MTAAPGKPPRRRQGRPVSPDGVGREELLRAARELLHTRRPDQVTSQEVARSAGVDPGLVRYYFGNVAGLMETLAGQLILELRALLGALDRSRSVEEQLRMRINIYIRFSWENPHTIQIISEYLLAPGDPAGRQLTETTLGETGVEFAELVDAGRETGELWDMDTTLLFAAVLALSQLPTTTTHLMEALIGQPIDDALLERYESFVVSLILGRDVTRPR